MHNTYYLYMDTTCIQHTTAQNVGARIGLVDDLKPKFKIAWNDDNNPAVGFKYLYLSDKDYQALPEVYIHIKQHKTLLCLCVHTACCTVHTEDCILACTVAPFCIGADIVEYMNIKY
jgi:hypothetical protein